MAILYNSWKNPCVSGHRDQLVSHIHRRITSEIVANSTGAQLVGPASVRRPLGLLTVYGPCPLVKIDVQETPTRATRRMTGVANMRLMFVVIPFFLCTFSEHGCVDHDRNKSHLRTTIMHVGRLCESLVRARPRAVVPRPFSYYTIRCSYY